jgi:transcriptional regulator NrdR family protein
VQCHHCGAPTRVLATRVQQTNIIQRRRECENGHRDTTYELSSVAYKAAKYQHEKKAKGALYNAEIARRAEQAKAMRAERLAGATCVELAAKYGMSVDMARYYTRLPRKQLYHGAKDRNPRAA